MARLALTVPSAQAVRDPRVPVRAAEIRAMLAELPLADPRGATAIAAEAVARLNRQPLAAAERLPPLEIYREHLAPLAELVRAPLRSDPYAVRRARVREGLAPLRRLVRELAHGYKLMVVADSERPTLRPAAAARAIARAIEMISLELVHAYEAYLPAPAHAWRELHLLLGYAERRRVLDTRAEKGDKTPSEAYRTIALLALTDPYRLPGGGIWEVCRFLDRHAGLARLGPPPPPRTGREGLFVVDLEADARPVPLEGASVPAAHRHRILDTAALADLLQRMLTDLHAGDPAPAREFGGSVRPADAVQLVAHLLEAWWKVPGRRHGRRERLVGVRAVAGLPAVHAALTGSAAETGSEGEIEIPSMSGLQTPFGREEGKEALWRLLNHGAGGVALAVPVPVTPAVRVGELVAFRNPFSPEEEWLTGIIRWLSHASDDEVHVGVQYLPPEAEAAELLPEGEEKGGRRRGPLPVLLAGSADRRVTVLAPHGTYRPERILCLRQDGETRHLEAAELVETTRAVDWFLATPL